MRLQTFFCYIGHWKCLKKGKAWQEKGGGKLEGVVTLKEIKCYGCAYFWEVRQNLREHLIHYHIVDHR